MMKCNTEATARAFARERAEVYGFSVFSAGWFVGTRDEVARIGVLDPKDPATHRFHVEAVNNRTGARTRCSSSLLTHDEACEMLKRFPKRKGRAVRLFEYP